MSLLFMVRLQKASSSTFLYKLARQELAHTDTPDNAARYLEAVVIVP